MRTSGLYLVVILGMTLALGTCAEVQAQLINHEETCTFGATGDSCTFDLRGTGSGTLKVDMKSNTSLPVLWRAVIVETAVAAGIKTSIAWGAGSFGGAVQRNVSKDKAYTVRVTYELFNIKVFPSSVQVRFNGPVTFIEPAPRPTTGGPEEVASCTQINESAITAQAVDRETITCGKLMTCRLDDMGGDTDEFKFTAPAGGAVSINISEVGNPPTAFPCWSLSGLEGQGITSGCGQGESGPLPSAGEYTILISDTFNRVGDYALSLQGVSESFQCGTSLTFGDLKSGRMDKEGDTDAFHFAAVVGQAVNINVTGVGNPPTAFPCWELLTQTATV